ncbi:MAG: glycosyltransferase family 2 protein [bacterium]|uniref:Glycosyl transferase family 2 n=2 Tax=Bacteria candidate phyla TaxID=1783234 RepID=A0A101I103_UNCT6|nr:MAG: Glycosyl transferase family 2 [candidate division TA06 bacterium 32_111]KUK86645.1 MAG: Glycosyl transferase family 2 [candidate division TA06 bacterium 34_109]MDI6699895.1 glycosyltransferase family 2 protein [bacterium]HAF07410.1 glycosyl transferase [candidate division WOR-3 bacterium]HCP17180.1 glycosyl transferase [candidate division WOR-3 bacterium]
MKLSVIIPVYNEKDYILKIIEKVKSVPLEKEIIVVDDMSKDGTREILKNLNDKDIIVKFHDKNIGKAGAIRTGQKYITGDIVVIQDADLEYDPFDYIKLVKPIVEGKYVACYGNRFSKENLKKMTFFQFMGNMVMTLSTSFFLGQKINDMETCYKVVRSDYFKKIDIRSKGFGIDPEITMKLKMMGVRIKEIPINYHPRSYKEGKKMRLKDAMRTFYTILKIGLFN